MHAINTWYTIFFLFFYLIQQIWTFFQDLYSDWFITSVKTKKLYKLCHAAMTVYSLRLRRWVLFAVFYIRCNPLEETWRLCLLSKTLCNLGEMCSAQEEEVSRNMRCVCSSQNRNRKYEEYRKKQIHSDTTVSTVNRRGLANTKVAVLLSFWGASGIKDEWDTGKDYRLSFATCWRWVQPSPGGKQSDGLNWVTLGRWRSTCGAAERDGDPTSEQRTDRCGAACSGTWLP